MTQLTIKVLAIFAIIYVWTLYSNDPGHIAIDEDGYPKNLNEKFREIIQGERFWVAQAKLIDQKIAKLAKEPDENRKLIQEHINELSEEKRMDADYYRNNPELQPSYAEAKAQSLRNQADLLELQDAARILNDMARDESDSLKKIRRLVIRQAELHRKELPPE